MTDETPSRSLTGRLLWALVGSLTAVALVLGAGGFWLINGIVESTADRLLGASARAITETVAVEDGEITLDLPPSALGMLENDARDNVYYSVRHGQEPLTGYPDLPSAPPDKIDQDESSFRYATFRGAKIRIAAEARRFPRVAGPVVVQVAETLDGRKELARQMFAGLAALEAALVGVAALLVWPTVKWSLGPVMRLREEMDARTAAKADFAPLPVSGVPGELVGLVTGFNALLHRIELSVEGVRRFTADASHQMRTPLTILRTHIAIVRKHGLESDLGKSSLADIELATDRLQGLLTGLITLARAEDAMTAPPIAEVDLRPIARKVATAFAPIAMAADVDIRLEASEHQVLAPADPLLVEELLSNLVDNAVRYNRAGGSVTLAVRTEGSQSLIEVIDDGPGIPAPDRTKVLQRFFRLSRDQQQQGSGLGLSIVQAIATRVHASLRLHQGVDGKGLAVTVSFESATNLGSAAVPSRARRRAKSAAQTPGTA